MRFAWDIDVAGNSTIRRQGARFCGIQHAGQDCKPPQQRSIEAGNLIGGFVAVLGKGEPRHEHVVRLQAEMHLAKRDEAAHQQTGPNEKR